MKIICYALEGSEVNSRELAAIVKDLILKLEKYGLDNNLYSLVDGNTHFPDTKNYFEQLVKIFSNNSTMKYEDILDFVWYIQEYGKNKQMQKESSEIFQNAKKFFKNISKEICFESTNGKIIILLSRNSKSIFEALKGAHGISIINGDVCVLLRGYKSIVWHEIAHLLGAKDHYECSSYESKDFCSRKSDCVMQWNPGLAFCDDFIKEIIKK